MTSLSTVVLKMAPSASSSSRRMVGVDEIAVMADGDLAARTIDDDRLRVFERARAGGGIADVADGARAGQLGQFVLVEDLRDEPHAVMALEFALLVAMGDDARAFLPAMLQGVEPEEGDFRRLGMTEYGENATLILGTVLKNGSRRR